MAQRCLPLLALLLVAPCLAASSVLLDSFEDGSAAGWRQQGAGPYLANYSVDVVAGGYHSVFCLRVTMRGKQGWCGVSAPQWRRPPVAHCTAIELDLRAGPGCQGIIIDVHQSDGARWWCLADAPTGGAWVHVVASPDRFIPIDNPHKATRPDLDKIAALWFSLRTTKARDSAANPPPAWFEIDNVALDGTPAGPAPGTSSAATPAPTPLPPLALPGVHVLLADTASLPRLGQDPTAPAAAKRVLARAGATVRLVKPGALGTLRAAPSTVLLWEGPVCRATDWPAVEGYLRRGGALLWWGAGLPFSRPVDASGVSLPRTTAPASTLTQGTFQSMNPLEMAAPWRLTAAGRKLWPGLPTSLAPGKCWFLTTDDSVLRQNNWPWVSFTPLLTLGYTARNWIANDRPFTGSVATLFRHHAGDGSGGWAGARVLLATTGSSPASPLCPRSPFFARALTGAVRELARPVKVDRALAALPPRPTLVTRANFFHQPQRVLGALDFDARGWSRPDVVYAVHRLGMNLLVAGVPWLATPAADGSVVDWARADHLVAEAEAGGWSVIFDPYCFGYGRFPWASDAGGKQARPASIYNPVFRRRFRAALAGLARRYAHRRAVVALFATPDTGTSAFYIDDSQVGRAAWAAYAARHGLPPALPQAPAKGELDLSPARAAYIHFWYAAYAAFMTGVIQAIRAEAPAMPILLRGQWLDVSPSFRLAARFRGVAPHCECVETSVDVESTLRGFALRYGVPISGENGWPKERGAALRMTAATILLGGYNDLLCSFGGPLWARPGVYDLETLERVWPALRGARYATPRLGLLIPDATTWASNPPDFFSQEGRPHVESLMERSGVPYMAVSAEWPRLDGLRALLDDGRNDVLPAASREVIAAWVENGGTLVSFPHTGRFDAAGGKASLASALGITFTPGAHAVGRGRVIVLAGPPPSDTGDPGAAGLLHALAEAGLAPPVRLTPPAAQAVFVKGRATYLVVYNKQTSLVGAFFSEDRLPAAVAALPNLTLTAEAPPGTAHARELVTGQPLPLADGRVTFALPRTDWRVVEFTP